MKTLQVIIPLFAMALAGCVGPGRPPHAFLPPISEEYFICEKCGSLHGGIYGKGPLVSFLTPDASKCWHSWHQVPMAEFQKIAAQRFPAEWEKASDFVKRTSKEPIQLPETTRGK